MSRVHRENKLVVEVGYMPKGFLFISANLSKIKLQDFAIGAFF